MGTYVVDCATVALNSICNTATNCHGALVEKAAMAYNVASPVGGFRKTFECGAKDKTAIPSGCTIH